jgi:hypothetical protein
MDAVKMSLSYRLNDIKNIVKAIENLNKVHWKTLFSSCDLYYAFDLGRLKDGGPMYSFFVSLDNDCGLICSVCMAEEDGEVVCKNLEIEEWPGKKQFVKMVVKAVKKLEKEESNG